MTALQTHGNGLDDLFRQHPGPGFLAGFRRRHLPQHPFLAPKLKDGGQERQKGQAVSATTTTSTAPMAWRLPLKETAKPPPARTALEALDVGDAVPHVDDVGQAVAGHVVRLSERAWAFSKPPMGLTSR